MRCTGIERTKKGRFSIFCDGEFVCALHPDVFALSSLEAGKEIDPAYLEDLRKKSEARITKDRALRLLSARSYTRKGLFDKLLAYSGDEFAESAVARMEDLGLVNDAEYARKYALDCMNLKGYSARRTKQALLEKGISRDDAEEVLSQLEQDPELAIVAVVKKKYLRFLEDEKGRIKTQNALLRLGYRYDDIRTVLANLNDDPAYYEEHGED